MEERDKYARRVFETALYFREMHEENQGGDTRAIRLLNPFNTRSVALRKFVLDELYKGQRLTLTEATVKLASWGGSAGRPALAEIESKLLALASEHEREFRKVASRDELIERAFLRLSRYIRRIRTEGASGHTRVFEFFIPGDFVPTGLGNKGPGHREHVVPCKFLLEASLDRFDKGASDEEVAHFIRRFLVIIEIQVDERDVLDRSRRQGGLGLKETMPEGWCFDKGCLFDRLHVAGIEFRPPTGISPCTH